MCYVQSSTWSARPELYFPGTADLWAQLKDNTKKKPNHQKPIFKQDWNRKNRAWKLTFLRKQKAKVDLSRLHIQMRTWPRMVQPSAHTCDKTILADLPTVLILWWAMERLRVPVTIYFFHNHHRSSFLYHLSVITLPVPSAIHDR